MEATLRVLSWSCSAIIGVALLIWARALSVRYNGWTSTLFRESHPGIHLPPERWREVNAKMATWIIRVFGILLTLISLLALIGLRSSN